MSYNIAKATASSSGGIGFLGLLTILLVGLKLTGFINWSWWWVISPVLLGLCGVVLVALAAIVFLFLTSK